MLCCKPEHERVDTTSVSKRLELSVLHAGWNAAGIDHG